MSIGDQVRPSRGLSGIKRLVLPVSIVMGFVVLCALGSWQVQRLHWKNDLIARVELRSKAAPKSIDSIDLDNTPGEQLDYVPA
ncbi:MAG: SURF1 family cytochrome oxidase biogenesis protein, partial [Pseudomonadota bacterium]